MVEVGIPVWKAKETLPKALDSLIAQTAKYFIVCLSIDGDDEDYQDIINEYRARGLKIRYIRSKTNEGPGMARQKIIDTTQCDYIMFLDADDMLFPQAVKNLYDAIRYGNYNILRSGFIREESGKSDTLLPVNINTITWFHGKIYKVEYLRKNNIRFLKGLRVDEDAYFNLIAWNSTTARGQIDDITYLWRDYKKSLTRKDSKADFFKKTYLGYLTSQVEGLKSLYRLNKNVNHPLYTQTFVNIYSYYMQAKFYQLDLTKADAVISSLKNEPWLSEFLNEGQNWINFATNIPCGAVYNDEYVYFYQEPINLWITRLLRNNDGKQEF